MSNGTISFTEFTNSSMFDDNLQSAAVGGHYIFNRHEFIQTNPWLAFPVVLVLFAASIVGTLGNVLILLAVFICKEVRTVESTFIVNLACSDLYVTVVADPFSLVGKLEGEHFFDSVPGLCRTVASICTVSCISSLMTIAMMSVNRYFYICRQEEYRKLFTRKNCVLICLSLYGIGTILVLLNTADIGDHSFDRKSLECIWDRMATYPYTVVFSVALVWLPLIVTGTCYIRIYAYVREHRRKIQQQKEFNGSISQAHRKQKLQLAKTLFLIYAVFMTCWVPYAMLIVIDSKDTYPHELHVFSTVFAHMHPSLNWLIYYLTNKRFAEAYRYILNCGKRVLPERAGRLEEKSNQISSSPKDIKEPQVNGDLANDSAIQVSSNSENIALKTYTHKENCSTEDCKCSEFVDHVLVVREATVGMTVIDN